MSLDRDAEKVLQRAFVKAFSNALQRTALRKLLILDAAEKLDDLRIHPGNQLESLSGNRKGQHSIRINDQWRMAPLPKLADWKDSGQTRGGLQGSVDGAVENGSAQLSGGLQSSSLGGWAFGGNG